MGKKTWGRKRHALVDTQGNVLEVTGAEKSDHEGGRALLAPLKGAFPRMKLIWGDSHYGGTFLAWVKEQLGWVVQTIHALTRSLNGACSCPKGRTWNGTRCSRKAFDLNPGVGLLSAVSPGSCAGVGSAAITRACHKAARRSSNSLRAIACSPRSYQRFHRDRIQTLTKTFQFNDVPMPKRAGGAGAPGRPGGRDLAG